MKIKANLAALGFATIFGCSFLASKIVLDYLNPLGLLAFRYLIAFVGFELLRLFKIVKVDLSFKAIKSLWWLVLFQPILYFLFEAFGLNLSTTSEAGIMISIIPIVVSILSTIFLKEKPSLVQFLCIVLSVLGIFVIQLSNWTGAMVTNYLGIILLFLAVLSAGFYNIFSRKVSKTISPVTITYYMVLGGMLAFNAIYLVERITSGSMSSYFEVFTSWQPLLGLLYLGLASSILAFFLVNYSLSVLPAPISSIYSNFSTVVTIVLGVLVLGETLSVYHYIGSIMIILGVYLSISLAPKTYKKI